MSVGSQCIARGPQRPAASFLLPPHVVHNPDSHLRRCGPSTVVLPAWVAQYNTGAIAAPNRHPDVAHAAGEEVVDLFLTTEGNVPVRLTTTAVDLASPEQTLTPMLTYDFLDFEQKPPPEDAFRMKVRAVLGYLYVLPMPSRASWHPGGGRGGRGSGLVGREEDVECAVIVRV